MGGKDHLYLDFLYSSKAALFAHAQWSTSLQGQDGGCVSVGMLLALEDFSQWVTNACVWHLLPDVVYLYPFLPPLSLWLPSLFLPTFLHLSPSLTLLLSSFPHPPPFLPLPLPLPSFPPLSSFPPLPSFPPFSSLLASSLLLFPPSSPPFLLSLSVSLAASKEEAVVVPRHLLVFINPVGGPGKGISEFKQHVQPRFDMAEINYNVIVTGKDVHGCGFIEASTWGLYLCTEHLVHAWVKV